MTTTPHRSTDLLLGLSAGLVLSYIYHHCSLKKNHRQKKDKPRRFGATIRVRPDHIDRYLELHANVWQSVLDRMTESNIRNFTIYYHKETSMLFQHFEWVGLWDKKTRGSEEEEINALFQADMQAIANDPITREWWKECEPCQEPFSQWNSNDKRLSQGGQGDWWAPLQCVCHCGHWPVEYSPLQK